MSDTTPGSAPLNNAAADRWIDAMAAVLGLPLNAANRDEIRANLLVAHRMAGTVLEFPIGDREEPLPVFRP